MMQNSPTGQPGKPSELIENLSPRSVANQTAESAPPAETLQPKSEEPLNKEKGKRPRERLQDEQLEKDKESKNSLKKRHLLSFDDQPEAEPVVRKPLVKRPLGADKVSSPSLEPTTITKQTPGQSTASLEERLRQQYRNESERMKEELFELDYCYWDTMNIVKKLKRKKKEKILDLLNICRLELLEHFQALIKSEPEELLFVIKDFIVPHNMSLYEVEVLQIKTKTGEPVLNFKKVKVPSGPTDTGKEGQKDLEISVQVGGPIRIIQRSRYEKSKAIYPFHNWHTLQLPRSK